MLDLKNVDCAPSTIFSLWLLLKTIGPPSWSPLIKKPCPTAMYSKGSLYAEFAFKPAVGWQVISPSSSFKLILSIYKLKYLKILL